MKIFYNIHSHKFEGKFYKHLYNVASRGSELLNKIPNVMWETS